MYRDARNTLLCLAGMLVAGLASASTLNLTAQESTILGNALLSASVPSVATSSAHFQVEASLLSCEISGATGGNLVCKAEAAGTSYSLDAASADAVFQLLSSLGGQHGGAHLGRVWATASALHCEHDADHPDNDSCTLTLD